MKIMGVGILLVKGDFGEGFFVIKKGRRLGEIFKTCDSEGDES